MTSSFTQTGSLSNRQWLSTRVRSNTGLRLGVFDGVLTVDDQLALLTSGSIGTTR